METYFRDALLELLNDNQLSVEQFAQKSRINLSEAHRYLRGECVPKFSNVVKIADAFGLSVDYLLGRAPYPEHANFRPTPAFSRRFRELLAQNNLSRYQLCKDTGIAINRLDDWYHGRCMPSLEKALTLAEHFHCSLDELLGRES